MKILHNNRCSKSRCALEILENKGLDFEVIKYLENPLTASEIKDLLKKLNMPAEAVIRKGEADYKANFKDKKMTEKLHQESFNRIFLIKKNLFIRSIICTHCTTLDFLGQNARNVLKIKTAQNKMNHGSSSKMWHIYILKPNLN